jgi:hypothetical protein
MTSLSTDQKEPTKMELSDYMIKIGNFQIQVIIDLVPQGNSTDTTCRTKFKVFAEIPFGGFESRYIINDAILLYYFDTCKDMPYFNVMKQATRFTYEIDYYVMELGSTVSLKRNSVHMSDWCEYMKINTHRFLQDASEYQESASMCMRGIDLIYAKEKLIETEYQVLLREQVKVMTYEECPTKFSCVFYKQPSVEQPSVEQPSVEQPPDEQPSVEQPPIEQPPVALSITEEEFLLRQEHDEKLRDIEYAKADVAGGMSDEYLVHQLQDELKQKEKQIDALKTDDVPVPVFGEYNVCYRVSGEDAELKNEFDEFVYKEDHKTQSVVVKKNPAFNPSAIPKNRKSFFGWRRSSKVGVEPVEHKS